MKQKQVFNMPKKKSGPPPLKATIISWHKFKHFGGLLYLAGIHFSVFKIIGMFFSFITGKIERGTNFSGYLI